MLAIIGGTGFERWRETEVGRQLGRETPYGAASAAPCCYQRGEVSFLHLARHGDDHLVPPHRVNYRANLWALREAGATSVLGLNAVGAITPRLVPGHLAVPSQIIDYSWGRAQTFWEPQEAADSPGARHVEFARPFSESLRARLLAAAADVDEALVGEGVYGVTQGPRLETEAEIERMARDGCDMVGMTLMPEAALARELNLPYAALALVVNFAAGRGAGTVHAQMEEHVAACRRRALAVLDALL